MTQQRMLWEEWNLLILRIDDLKIIIRNEGHPPSAEMVKEWEEMSRNLQAHLTVLVARTKTCLRYIMDS